LFVTTNQKSGAVTPTVTDVGAVDVVVIVKLVTTIVVPKIFGTAFAAVPTLVFAANTPPAADQPSPKNVPEWLIVPDPNV
jgi:hypothetical protein